MLGALFAQLAFLTFAREVSLQRRLQKGALDRGAAFPCTCCIPAPLSLKCGDDVVGVESSSRQQGHMVPAPPLVERGEL